MLGSMLSAFQLVSRVSVMHKIRLGIDEFYVTKTADSTGELFTSVRCSPLCKLQL